MSAIYYRLESFIKGCGLCTANNDALTTRKQCLSAAKWMLCDVERPECVVCHVVNGSYLRLSVVIDLQMSASTANLLRCMSTS